MLSRYTITAILITLTIGGGFYFYQRQHANIEQPILVQSPSTITSPTSKNSHFDETETSNWLSYKDDSVKITFKYPSNFKVENIKSNLTLVISRNYIPSQPTEVIAMVYDSSSSLKTEEAMGRAGTNCETSVRIISDSNTEVKTCEQDSGMTLGGNHWLTTYYFWSDPTGKRRLMYESGEDKGTTNPDKQAGHVDTTVMDGILKTISYQI
ncbi:MAG: hypothetical protein WAW90_00170 [Minisyncoccia bacterium]